MRLDKFSNPVFNDQDIFQALYQGHMPTADMIVSYSDEIESLEEITGIKFQLPLQEDFITVEEYDRALQSDWRMPNDYKNMDMMEFLVSICPKENYQRVIDEMDAFTQRNMLDLLRWLKYFVDTMQANNVVWGVGRGSSVASYVLYLIGVHSIDSVKYNLDWQEFLR